jgi:hypothetical protein
MENYKTIIAILVSMSTGNLGKLQMPEVACAELPAFIGLMALIDNLFTVMRTDHYQDFRQQENDDLSGNATHAGGRRFYSRY